MIAGSRAGKATSLLLLPCDQEYTSNRCGEKEGFCPPYSLLLSMSSPGISVLEFPFLLVFVNYELILAVVIRVLLEHPSAIILQTFTTTYENRPKEDILG